MFPTKNELRVGIKFETDNQQLDISKQKLNELIADLQSIQKQNKQAGLLGKTNEELKEASQNAAQLEHILKSSWNSKLGQLDIGKFNNELRQSKLTVEQLKSSLDKVSPTAFNKIASSILNTNLELKKTSTLLDKMALTMANTVRFGISSSIFNNLTNSIQKAYDYSVKLDSSLNDIRIVTNKSAEDMDRFAVQANKAAQNLGKSTRDYTEASLIYYQQGLSDQETAARTETTLKAANVTGQSPAEVSEQLTAVWNGYKVSAAETEHYVDKLAAVAAATAADLEELSTGMSKVASAASVMGVDVDQLNAQLATIVSVTREAPETIGTSLKNVYARMSDIKAGLDNETSLGKYSGQMAKFGINVLDTNGKLRNMGEIVEEIGGKWSSLTREQQISLAQTIAGQRQYSRMISLFDNWDDYTKALETSRNSMGTLQHQQDIYMESTQAHLQKISTAAERTYDILFDTKTVNNFADVLSGLIGIFNNLLAGIGGGASAFTYLGSIATSIFNQQIGGAITRQIENLEKMKKNADMSALKQKIADMYTMQGETGVNSDSIRIEKEAEVYQKIAGIKNQLSQDEYNQLMILQKQIGLSEEKLKNAENYKDLLVGIFKNENVTYEEMRARLKVSQEQEKEYNKQMYDLQKLDSIWMKAEEGKATDEEKLGLLNNLKEIQKSGKDLQFTEQEIQKISLALEGKNTNTKEIWDIFDEKAASLNNKLKEQYQIQDKINTAMERKKFYNSGEYDKEKQAQEERERLLQEEVQLKQRQQAISALVQSLSTVVTLVTTISGIVKTINDDSLTAEEKFKQILTVAVTTLPIIIPQIVSIAKQLPTMAIGLGLISKGNYDVAKSAGTAGAALWGAYWPLLAIIGALTIAIVGLVNSCIDLYNWYHQDSTAAAEASERAQELTEAYNEAKQKAEELKTTLSDYSGAVKQLNQLKKGTKEYAEALNEANEKAKQIREEYDLYDKSSYKNGVLTFDDDAWYDIQTEAFKKTAKAETRMYGGKILANNLNLRSQETDSKRSIFWESYKDGLTSVSSPIYGGTVDQVTNSLIKLKSENEDFYSQLKSGSASMTEWVETLDGNAWGLNFLSEEIDKNKEEFFKLAEATEKVTNANLQYYEAMNKSYLAEKYGARLASMSYNAQGEFDEAIYTQLLIALEKSAPQRQAEQAQMEKDWQNQNQSVNIQGDIASSQKAWSNEIEQGWGKFVMPVVTGSLFATGGALGLSTLAIPEVRDFAKRSSGIGVSGNLNKKVIDDLKNEGLSDKDLENLIGRKEIKSDEDLAKAYAQLTGTDISKATLKGKKYVDDANNTILDFSSNEARGKMRAAIFNQGSSEKVQQDTQKQAEEGSNQVIDLLEKASMSGSEAGKQYGTDFTLAVANAMANKDKVFDFSQNFGTLSPEEAKKLSQKSDQDILNMFGYTEEDVQKLGFENGQQFAENFRAGLSDENYKWDPSKAVDQVLAGQDDKLKKVGLKKEELADYSKYLLKVAEDSEILSDEMKENAEISTVVAKSVMRMNNGVEKLAKGQEDWIDVLGKSSKESEEYFDALTGIQDAMGDLLDLSEDAEKYLDGDFFTKNAKLIEKAAEGDAEAIDKLRDAVADDIAIKIALKHDIDQNTINNISNQVDNLQAMLQQKVDDKTIQIGTQLDTTNLEAGEQEMIDACNGIVQAAHMTADEANAFFGAIGFEPTFVMEEKEVTSTKPITKTVTTDSTEIRKHGDTEVVLPATETYSYISGYIDVPEKIQIPALNADGTPQIKSLVYKGGGSANNFSSRNRGGGSPSGKKGKSGGGGGGGGSSKKADKMDNLKEEIDRYHDVNVKLEQIETTLDRLEDAEDKAFGGDLVKNYNKQIEALNNQITVTQQKLGIAANEMKELQGKLSGSGVRFNSDGTIGNYAAALQAQENYVNGIINHYNSLGADAQESYKETVEQAKKNFDEFKKNLERYDELVTDEIPDLQDQIQEAIDKITEKNIEKFKMEVDLRLDMAEAERDWNEFKKKVIDQIDDDDILGNAKARIEDLRTYLNDLDTGEVQALGKHVQETLDELRAFDKGLDNVYGRERAQSLEDLEEYFDNLKDALEEIVEIQDELQEDVLDQMDAVQDKIDDQVDTFEAISDLIEHDMTLIQLTLGEDAYAELSNFYKAQQDNYNKQLDFQRQQVDYWKQQMDAVEQGSEQFDAAREKWADAVADWNDLVENTIENLQDQLENTINAIFKNLNDNLTNNKGLQYVSDEFEIVGERAEQFLDEINRLQGIADLADKYQDAINNTDNISAQRKLNAAMEEQLNALKDADKLSEKDIERAQKRYDLTVAQIALEEAQAQKNTLRLRRDTQGNYRYQYVADDEAVNDAENKLKEAYNSLYNFDKERYIDNLNEAYDTWNDYQEAMAEAAQINDPELRAEKEALIQQEYGEIINGIVEQNEKIRTDLRESAFMDLANLKQEEYDTYMNMTQEEQDVILNNLIPQWDDGIQQMISSIKDEGGFEPTTTEAFDNIKQAAEDYDAAVQDIQEDINATVGDVLDGEDKIIAINQDLTVSNNDVVDSYKAELTAVQELAAGVNDLADAYKDELQAAKDAHDYLAKQREEAAKAAAEAEKGKTAAKETVATPLPETKPAQTTAAPAPAQNSNPRAGYRLGGQTYTIVSGDTLSGIARRFYGKASLYTEIWAHNKDHLRGKNANRIWPGEIVYLDTGGYTGEWNSGGKLGVLHQKELVLNAKDTKNLLDTVAIMRNITAAVGENTLQRLSGATSGSYIANGDGKGILEQDVHITANFPNVRSAIEIETALNNLTNAASQYIGKQ